MATVPQRLQWSRHSALRPSIAPGFGLSKRPDRHRKRLTPRRAPVGSGLHRHPSDRRHRHRHSSQPLSILQRARQGQLHRNRH